MFLLENIWYHYINKVYYHKNQKLCYLINIISEYVIFDGMFNPSAIYKSDFI